MESTKDLTEKTQKTQKEKKKKKKGKRAQIQTFFRGYSQRQHNVMGKSAQ